MSKKLICVSVLFFLLSAIFFAGDIASFENIGFSSDGKVYMFGEYGVTDKQYNSYANIYAVDIAKNDFISSGTFKTSVSRETKPAREVYDSLLSDASQFIKSKNIEGAKKSNIIYVDAKTEAATDTIEFRDFTAPMNEEGRTFAVRLHSVVEGKGSSAQSSFYLVIEKKDANGNVTVRKIGGNPDFKRKGVISYRINRILTSANASELVFVIEKEIADTTGSSIRYMVETVVL